jgi:hypothetical protein
MEAEGGRTSPLEPWTRAEIWSLIGKAAFWLVLYAVTGAVQQAWRWRVLRARYF